MYERSNIPVSKSVEEQSWWDVETSGGRGLDSVTLYRGFYVEIDNSPDMPFIWLGICISFGREYPDQTFAGFIAAGSKMADDQRVAALQGKIIGITGIIELYEGKPEIKVTSADQFKDLDTQLAQ